MPSPVPELINPSDLKSRGTLRKVNRLIRWASETDSELSARGLRDLVRLDAPPEFHPFRVYRLPSSRRTIDPAPEGWNDAEWYASQVATNWRKVFVRSGRIGQTDVTGTDGISTPDSAEYPTALDNEIELPTEQSEYAIWIEYLVPTAAEPSRARSARIMHSADPVGDGDWPGYPGSCTTEGTICRRIALVDTTDQGKLKIRQFIRADEPDWYQACVSVGGSDKVLNVPCDGPPFDFDP